MVDKTTEQNCIIETTVTKDILVTVISWKTGIASGLDKVLARGSV